MGSRCCTSRWAPLYVLWVNKNSLLRQLINSLHRIYDWNNQWNYAKYVAWLSFHPLMPHYEWSTSKPMPYKGIILFPNTYKIRGLIMVHHLLTNSYHNFTICFLVINFSLFVIILSQMCSLLSKYTNYLELIQQTRPLQTQLYKPNSNGHFIDIGSYTTTLAMIYEQFKVRIALKLVWMKFE